LGTWGKHCKHNAKHIVNNKIPTPPPPPPPPPQQKKKKKKEKKMRKN